MSKISKRARLAAIHALDRLLPDHVEVHDYGSGGKMLCETILETEIQRAIDEAVAERDAEIERLRLTIQSAISALHTVPQTDVVWHSDCCTMVDYLQHALAGGAGREK